MVDRKKEWLTAGLRQLYSGSVVEPMPDAFRELLDELERRDNEKTNS